MSSVTPSRPAFNIGIAMAGAVSGGAYSAGVFDFLVEALDEWQKAKDRGDLVPDHDVFVSAMSGTSAGGITAAMGLASLAAGVRAVEEPAVNPNQTQPIKRTLPELYDIWVKKVRLFDSPDDRKAAARPDAIPSLLDTGDIRAGGAPDSLLNSDVLTQIAREGLSSIVATGKKHKYLTEPLHLFLTHTNLDGVPIPIDFLEGDGYTMMMHEGRAHFAVRGIGARPYPPECGWLKDWDDHGVDIDLTALRSLGATRSDQPLKEPFESYAQAALTTSAFPFGFSARRVAVNTAKTRIGAMPFAGSKFTERLKSPGSTGFLPRPESETLAHYVCVDGGALNNEPFEIVRWAIKHSDETNNVRDSERASRAVILIAPFPPTAAAKTDVLARADRDISLKMIGLALVPALLNQARFKASDLIAASDPNVYSRYLISPKRADDATKPALASTSLYAFGGFLDEQFREHDFQLGRRNCQWFLRKHFTLARTNPVFGPDAARRFQVIEPEAKFRCDPDEWPIIPLVGTAAAEVQPPESWPVLARRKLVLMRDALRTRLDLLAASYTAQFFGNYAGLRSALRLSWWRNRVPVIDAIMQIVHDQLEKYEQLEPSRPQTLMERLSDLVRRPWVVAGLIALMFLAFAFYQFLMDQMTP